ncbi:MAG: YkgJ family cysteine cluster protein [Ignavibacteriota bacterium]
MDRLIQIRDTVRLRTEEIARTQPSWPCRKGCDDCCRSLASVPRVTREEWHALSAAVADLPEATAAAALRRIRDSATATRPVVCPLLDTDSGACLVYEARPVACRAYGFYAERESVLGCTRIETIGQGLPDIVWGNHAALEDRLRLLGADAPLWEWLDLLVTSDPRP